MNEINSFERVNDNLSNGTSLIKNREIKNPKAFIGDFLSRIWKLYGKPKQISDDGFGYTFRDKKTGLIFTVYSAGSGPAYGGNSENIEKLKSIIERFDKMLDNTENADCEIEIETDYGNLKTGAKNGIPYDNYEDE